MKYFITGATGFIGKALTQRLVSEGHIVHALIRSPQKARDLNHQNIKLFVGEILNDSDLEEAMKGCDIAFHMAAFAGVWSPDARIPYKIHVEATEKIFQIAQRLGIKKVVMTSSAATIGPSEDGNPCDENTVRKTDFFNIYEITKAQAEEKAQEYVRNGLHVVIVNPSRVYGPGLLSESNSMTKIIRKYYQGTWRIIPGSGKKVGNYVYINDVVNGHILAAEKGRPGERYILGGSNVTFNDFFATLARVTGKKRILIKMPYQVMMAAAWIVYGAALLFRQPPLITPSWVRKYLNHWTLSSRKAIDELGYTIIPLEEGMKKTLEWIKNSNL